MHSSFNVRITRLLIHIFTEHSLADDSDSSHHGRDTNQRTRLAVESQDTGRTVTTHSSSPKVHNASAASVLRPSLPTVLPPPPVSVRVAKGYGTVKNSNSTRLTASTNYDLSSEESEAAFSSASDTSRVSPTTESPRSHGKTSNQSRLGSTNAPGKSDSRKRKSSVHTESSIPSTADGNSVSRAKKTTSGNRNDFQSVSYEHCPSSIPP